MDMTIESESPSLTIGDDYTSQNTLEFTIKLTGTGAVGLQLQVPVGKDGVLLRPEDANDMEIATPGTDPSPHASASAAGSTVWRLGGAKGIQVLDSGEVSVSIRNVLCRADEGKSLLTIKAITGDRPPVTITRTLDVAKAKPTTAPDNPILYFLAEPTFVIAGGEVTLTWSVVGRDPARLEIPERDPISPASSGVTDRPPRSRTYTLKVAGKQRQVTVDVLSPGWHSSLKPLGEHALPSVIFDSGGRSRDALYALFLRPGPGGRQAVLAKSLDGITGWEVIDKAIPAGMESSPGVHLSNRLWLIGGSAVDPSNITNRICYYDLAHPDGGWQDATVAGFDDGARMGHACVIAGDNTIWMLGGLDEYRTCLSDVWRLTIGDGGAVTASPLPAASPFTARCMFSAVNFRNMIWVCGGVSSPNGNPVSDIWSSPSDAPTWAARPKPVTIQDLGNYVVQDAIGTGTAVCGDTLFAVVAKRTGGPGLTIMPAMRAIAASGLTATSDAWTPESAPALPRDLILTPHHLAMVGFRGRLYLRCLHRNALYGDEPATSPLFVYVMTT